VGTIIKKKIKPIIIGDITFPSKVPNSIQKLFKDVNKFGLTIVINKNTKDRIKDQSLIVSPIFNG
jgi:hypothetical protein